MSMTQGLAGIETRFTELGRIRMGHKVAGTKNGKEFTRPEKLEHWRLTSHSRTRLDVAAELYGGEVKEWTGAPSPGQQWEVFTTSDALDVMIPPLVDRVVRLYWELWKGPACQRRCDGDADVRSGEACQCPLDLYEREALAKKGQACRPTTRLSVILPYLPGLGVWRLEIHGKNGAAELAGTARMLAVLGASGQLREARLRLDTRTGDVDGQLVTYPVPVLEANDRMVDFALPSQPARPELVRPQAALPALPGGTQSTSAPDAPGSRFQRAPADASAEVDPTRQESEALALAPPGEFSGAAQGAQADGFPDPPGRNSQPPAPPSRPPNPLDRDDDGRWSEAAQRALNDLDQLAGDLADAGADVDRRRLWLALSGHRTDGKRPFEELRADDWPERMGAWDTARWAEAEAVLTAKLGPQEAAS